MPESWKSSIRSATGYVSINHSEAAPDYTRCCRYAKRLQWIVTLCGKYFTPSLFLLIPTRLIRTLHAMRLSRIGYTRRIGATSQSAKEMSLVPTYCGQTNLEIGRAHV